MILLCSDAVTIVVNLIVAFVRTVTIHVMVICALRRFGISGKFGIQYLYSLYLK